MFSSITEHTDNFWTCKLTDPNNNEYIVKNLTQFANSNNLQRSLLNKVSSGERKHHKGWKCEKLN